VSDGTIGIVVQEPSAAASVDAIRRYEAAGVAAAWVTTGGLGPDGPTLLAAAAAQTDRILLGTCIVPILPRHPLTLAQQTRVIASFAPGRFRLGVGPSHKPPTQAMYGFDFQAPLGHLREYIGVLKSVFDSGSVDFDGRYYHAHGKLPAPVPGGLPVMASALRTRAFHLCGEIADGAISWVCPLEYLRDTALPAMREGAKAAGRPTPLLVAHVPFCLSDDADVARAAARQQLATYPRLPYYAQMFADAGFGGALEGEWSDAMVDGIVAHGDEDHVAKRIRAYLDAGSGEIIAAPIIAGGRERDLARAAEFLAGLATPVR
jgi:F420-dependent oxidoreductase-like protein